MCKEKVSWTCMIYNMFWNTMNSDWDQQQNPETKLHSVRLTLVGLVLLRYTRTCIPILLSSACNLIYIVSIYGIACVKYHVIVHVPT